MSQSKIRSSWSKSSGGSMCARNIGSPHIGHGRLPTGGICDRCMVRPFYIQAGAQIVSLSPTPARAVGDVRQRLPVDSPSLEQFALALRQSSAVKCCNARAVRYWHVAFIAALHASDLFRSPVEPNPHKRVRRLSQPKELTHVAYLLDRDYGGGSWFLCNGASHTERRCRAWEVVSR